MYRSQQFALNFSDITEGSTTHMQLHSWQKKKSHGAKSGE
jgi:hypothetical protein